MKNFKAGKNRIRDPVTRALLRCAAGALLLLNPNFNLVDILPDAIGYLLIISGLRALEPISPSVAEARQRFSMLLRVSLARIAALPLTFVVGYNEKTFLLIFTFGFALVETIFLLPAFHYLYDGTAYLSLRYGGEGIKKAKPPRVITAVFIIARAALNVLPELQYLPTQYDQNEGLVTEYQPINLAELSHMLVLANIVLTLAVAIVWAVRFRGYLKRLRRDGAFTSALSDTLAAAEPSGEGAALLRMLKPAFTLITVAMFTSLDFYADGYNLIPDLLPALLLLAASIMLYRAGQCGRALPAAASVYTALTGALAILNYIYADRYFAFAAVGGEPALRWQTAQTILALICSALLIIVIYMLCRALVKITDRHAGLFAEAEFRTKNAKTQRERLRTRNLIWACFALTLAAESMSAVYGALVISYAALWMPAAALTLGLGALTAYTTGNLYYQVELRYGK